MCDSSSDHVALIWNEPTKWTLKTRSMYSVCSSQSSVLSLEYLSYHICCNLPAAHVFASSGLKRNGQPSLFMCRSMLGPPTHRHHHSLWLHPLLLCHSHSLIFQMWQLAGTAWQPSNKLMSKIWVHSEHTVDPGTLLPVEITLILLVWCGSCEDKKGARGARHAKLCCGWCKWDATSPGDKPFYVIVVWCH